MAAFVLAEFASGKAMLDAAQDVRALGFVDLDAYSPYALEGMEDALGLRRSPVPAFVLAGGIVGGLFGYLMMYWCNAVDYPINVGGRPLNSYPAFVPITFELTILFAALAAVVSMLGACRLPRTYHPVFRIDRFRSASDDRFWLSVAVEDEGARRKVVDAISRSTPLHITSLDEALA